MNNSIDNSIDNYDPTDPTHRAALADGICQLLIEGGFVEEEEFDTKEKVFCRHISPRTWIAIYTTIDQDGLCRDCGEDSIKLAALYACHTGEIKGYIKTQRIHRVGTIGGILERIRKRGNALWKRARSPITCHCGAVKILSKKGTYYCADLCWLPYRLP